MFIKTLLKCALTRTNEFRGYKTSRGMSIWHDYVDWVGGFPFEVAKIRDVQSFYEKRGFTLSRVVATKSWGNNQFVFVKNKKPDGM
jgi:hypothetical protein